MREWVVVEPLVDTPEQHAYWRTLKVGDRVRTVVTGECPLTHSKRGMAAANEVGTIVAIDENDPMRHPYLVMLDRGYELFGADAIFGPWCAAMELEPLE